MRGEPELWTNDTTVNTTSDSTEFIFKVSDRPVILTLNVDMGGGGVIKIQIKVLPEQSDVLMNHE